MAEWNGYKSELYPFYNNETHQIEFQKMKDFLEKLEDGSCVVMQPTCQNPTGAWMDISQWEVIGKISE